MNLSHQQSEAVAAILRWYKIRPSRVFRLFGYAGTGKTTIAIEIAKQIGGVVMFAAYTGKAASVMRAKGCAGATTIHRLIYRPRVQYVDHIRHMETKLADLIQELKDAGLSLAGLENHPEIKKQREEIQVERAKARKPNFDLNEEADVTRANLIIIDEASMVGAELGGDLLSFGIPILVLGDPAQLPPIGDTGMFTNCEPDFMLTEIHRQAEGSPIIQLATAAREKRRLRTGRYGSSAVIKKRDLTPGLALEHDQILVGRNATRRATNMRVRELYGMENLLTIGEKVVCLRNNHDLGLLNGTQWSVTQLYSGAPYHDIVLMQVRNPDAPEDEEGSHLDVEAHTHYFEGRADELPLWDKLDAEEFDYGYALTTHKAQGSQWNKVLLIDESYCFSRDKHKWLYTAITRAAESITIVQ